MIFQMESFLCQTPALIGSNLVAVNVALYIVPAVDGSVNLKVEVPYYAGVSYEKRERREWNNGASFIYADIN